MSWPNPLRRISRGDRSGLGARGAPPARTGPRLAGLAALLGVVLAAASMLGCRSRESLGKACEAGDGPACHEACKKGLTGKGGCFDAAEQLRRQAQEQGKRAPHGELGTLYGKSCDGGFAEGCLFAAQILEMPHLESLEKLVGGQPPADQDAPLLMPEQTIAFREQRLEASCSGGSGLGCRRLGDVLLGKDAARATTAYEKYCKTLPETSQQCVAARKEQLAYASDRQRLCHRGLADACEDLGNLIHQVDVPRAVGVFVKEGQLRGVADQVGGPPGFVARRVQEARRWGGPRRAEAAASARRWSVQLGRVSVEGRIGRASVVRALERQRESLAGCRDRVSQAATPAGSADLRLLVDRTGDPWQVGTVGGTLKGTPVAACLEEGLRRVVMPPPEQGLATVDVSLAFSPRDGGVEAPGTVPAAASGSPKP